MEFNSMFAVNMKHPVRLLPMGLILPLLMLMMVSRCYATPESSYFQQLFEQGNQHYQDGAYDSAIICYSTILAQGVEGDDLYYNLGNAHFRLKDYAQAVLFYQRALKLNPKHRDAAFNLAVAQSFTVDRFNAEAQWPLIRWFHELYQLFTPRIWAFLSYLTFALFLGGVLLIFFTRRRSVWTASLLGSSLLLLLFIGTVWGGMVAQRRGLHSGEGVIMQSVVSVKGAPNSGSKDLFLLHSGSTVEILHQEGEWVEIRITDGHQGWVEKSTLTEI